MNKIIPCKVCLSPIDVPENEEFDEVFCNKCMEAKIGAPMMDYIENNAEDIEDIENEE